MPVLFRDDEHQTINDEQCIIFLFIVHRSMYETSFIALTLT
jgi:hypothetical protein